MIIRKTKKLKAEEIKDRVAKSAVQFSQRRSDEALRQILDLIFQGKLPPGARLPAERELAELIGISRNTLRDALNKLEARGYVERRSKSGNYVCTAIPQSLSAPLEEIVEQDVVGLRDIVDIRKALETWAARKAAEAPTAEMLKQLKNCVRTMRANAELRSDEQFARYSEADRQFHELIAEMTGNPVYVHLFHYFTALLSRSMTITRELMQERFAEHNIKVHENILVALGEADPDAAERTMKEHFQFVEELIAPKPRRAAKASPSKQRPKLR
jgi:GntR family transcriptional regulator, transcriptional repressor for pyruvate dehydrogenase complex